MEVPRHAAALGQRPAAVPRGGRSILFTRSSSSSRSGFYKIIRPHDKIGEVYERNLRRRPSSTRWNLSTTARLCEHRIDDDWIICPYAGPG